VAGTASSTLPGGVARLEERVTAALHVQPAWADSMPWLLQGITASGDMTLFGDSPAGAVMGRWLKLRDQLGASTIIHSRQVHGAVIRVHGDPAPGLWLAPDCDGHATRRAGALLAVSVADCVPISIVAPAARAVALLHGGWRGVAAGILERGVDVLTSGFGADADDLRMHLGPAICGDCYEVGAEVIAALGQGGAHADGGTGRSGGRALLDLRAVLARRAVAAGIQAVRISVSVFCTRCGDSPFFSHRGGCRERQVSVLGLQAGAA
jgi:polyphenol oxidase